MVAGCGPRWPSPVAVEGRIDVGAFTNSGAGHQDGAGNAGHRTPFCGENRNLNTAHHG